MNKPFIHMLTTPLNKYVFDVNTNQLIQVGDKLYDYLLNIEKKSDSEYDEPDSDIKRQMETLSSLGYLSCKHPKRMKHNQSDLIEYHLNDNIAQMILQVTQQCNFRCAYCPYTLAEFDSQRGHTSKTMTLSTAKAAVDFFAEHSSNQEDVCIGFYGGEPLLEFDLIKQIVSYSENHFVGKNLTYTITTNGSLFTKDNIQFLNDHAFGILISLDGPPEIHNRSRKFAATGKGTFSVIEKNLNMIKEQCPDLLDKIMFNVVVDPRYSSNKLHEMFSENKMFSGLNIQSTLIDDFFSIEKVVPDEVYVIEQGINEFKTYEMELGKYPKEKISNVAYYDFFANNEKIRKAMRAEKILFDEMSHYGPCIPGQRRLFVDVNGGFYPCERVSETSEAMNIGNVHDGFDYEKVRSLLNISQLTEKQCKNCFALRHCNLCAKYCDNNGELSSELKLSNCKNVRYAAEETFKNYLMFKELKQ